MDAVLNASMLPGNVVRDPDEYRFGSWDIINPLSIASEKKMTIKIKCLYQNHEQNPILLKLITNQHFTRKSD